MVSEGYDIAKLVVTWSLNWLGRQQATTVILLAILTAILYIAYVHLPTAFGVFRSEMAAHREFMTKELEKLSDHDRDERQFDRKTYESTLIRVLDMADHRKTSSLLQHDDLPN